MQRWVFWLFLWSFVNVVQAMDLVAPKDLKASWKKCQSVAWDEQTCAPLRAHLETLNHFDYQLKINPLRYGRRVLALQELIAHHENMLHLSNATQANRLVLEEHRQQLRDRLLVIKWLESPQR